jgi:uncharacterized protein (TIGR03437 family)
VLITISGVVDAQFGPAPGSPVAAGTSPVFAAAGYFDWDEITDLVVVNSGDNTAILLRGNNSGGFAPEGSPVRVGAGALAIAGWRYGVLPGVVVANQADNTVSVLQYANGFTAVTGDPFAVGLRPAFVAVADLNNDGVPDFAIANSGDATVTVMLGLATGSSDATPLSFVPSGGSPFAVGSKPVSIAIADFNGDNVPDLAVVNSADNTVSVLLGNGSGAFTPAAGSPFLVGEAPQSVTVGDFDRDGQADLAVANLGDNTITILLGTGNGGFTDATSGPIAVGTAPSSIAAADFNQDGNLDLAIANTGDDTLTVLLGNGRGGFEAASYSPLPVESKPESVTIVGNGKPGLAISNSGSNNITVLLNNYPATVPATRVLSAASASDTVSAGSIVAIYGENLANETASAATVPLHTELGGVSALFKVVNILDGPVFSGPMPLFYVGPTQINAQIPADASFPSCNAGSGSVYFARVELFTPSGVQTVSVNATPAPVPGLFTANENGTGPAVAQFVTNLPDGTQKIIETADCSGGIGACVPAPLDVTAGVSALVLYGTGISEYSTFPNGLTVLAGSQPLQVFYAGPSPQYVALDQINVWMPSSLAGSGVVNLTVSLLGATPGLGLDCPFNVTSNVVTISIE